MLLKKSNLAISTLSSAKASDYKVNLVASCIRNKSAEEAFMVLAKLSQLKASKMIKEVLISAIANLKVKNQSLSETDVLIDEVRVGRATYIRRVMPAGRGKTGILRKNRTNISVIVRKKDII